MLLLNFKNIHYNMSFAYVAFKHGEDTKTVHNGLVRVFGLHYTPNLRTSYLSLENMQHDQYTWHKST